MHEVGACHVEAWAPAVPGVVEVFHARMLDYAYPRHCHDTWAVLIVDEGAIRYDLDGRRYAAANGTVTILPPGVVHDGRPAPGVGGFRKRELYLDQGFLPAGLVGAAVDRSNVSDPALARIHRSLADREDAIDVEARLALVGERIAAHLGVPPAVPPGPDRAVARQLRELLDEHLAEPFTLAEAAARLDRSVPHLLRSFSRQFGISPHAYVVGRRVEAARFRFLRGDRPADVAAAVGFHDQAHLTRHFRRYTSVTPARYAGSHGR